MFSVNVKGHKRCAVDICFVHVHTAHTAVFVRFVVVHTAVAVDTAGIVGFVHLFGWKRNCARRHSHCVEKVKKVLHAVHNGTKTVVS